MPELLKLVDETILKSNDNGLTMGLLPAVKLSYLSYSEQKQVYSGIEYTQATPSRAQTMKLRKLAKSKTLNFNLIEEILNEK